MTVTYTVGAPDANKVPVDVDGRLTIENDRPGYSYKGNFTGKLKAKRGTSSSYVNLCKK